MPTIGWAELMILAVLAIVIVGPRDLPRVMRTVGQWVGKARRLAGEFQSSFDEMARQTELEDLKKEVERLKRESDPGGTGDIDPTTGKSVSRAHKRADIGGASAKAAATGGAHAALARAEVDPDEGEDDEAEDDLIERLAAEVEPQTLADYERREGEIENMAALDRGRLDPAGKPAEGTAATTADAGPAAPARSTDKPDDGDDGTEIGEGAAKSLAGGKGAGS